MKNTNIFKSYGYHLLKNICFFLGFLFITVVCFIISTQNVAAEQISLNELTIQRVDDNEINVYIDGKFYASYRSNYKGTPIVWPICGPNQALVTRAWPMIADVDVISESNPEMKVIYQNAIISERGGVKDHPHHRSLWFNHGNVLGGDFWGGTQSIIKQNKLLKAESDGKTAVIKTENYWFNDKLGRNVCRDVRTLIFGQILVDGNQVRYLDFSIDIFALEDNVYFADTKEGTFGIRVPSSMSMTTKKLNSQWGGEIINDKRETGNETWSKRSLWVNYSGPVELFLTGDELNQELQKNENANDFPLIRAGIAVLSGPNSLGSPAWRHVRDYGLFASNPFGQRDFEPNNPNANGTQTLNKGESMQFNFRVLFHDGSLTPQNLDQIYQDYIQ